MGLDMYLRAEQYVSGGSYDPESKALFENLVASLCGEKEKDAVEAVQFPSARVMFTVAYWRKANHIHSWFVRECQDGKDECQLTYVDRAKLRELRELCLRVLADKDEDLAEELLAPKGGFFFGSVSYGDWFWDDLRDTVKQLDRVLALPSGWGIYYQSSW